ncbi:MAG: glycoside hydrolase family 97 N-terminal domain-containing protein [Ferruginibacter sp.]
MKFNNPNNFQYYLLATLFTLHFLNGWSIDTLQVHSPSGRITVKVWMARELNYQVFFNNRKILESSLIDLLLDKERRLSINNPIKSSAVNKIRAQIISPVPEKRKLVTDEYNLLTLIFRQPYRVEFRAYDDGVAYRISTGFKDSVYIINEVAHFSFR